MKIFFALAIAVALAMPATHALAAESLQTIVDFSGELVDQNAAPVSGVLPLEFRIYASPNDKKTLAVEKHFVAVVDGNYAIALGEQATIKTSRSELYVAVLLDGKELTRQKVQTQKQIVAQAPQTVRTPSVGEAENDNFKLECPAGYVVTGIEGSSKEGLKSLRAICAKTVIQ